MIWGFFSFWWFLLRCWEGVNGGVSFRLRRGAYVRGWINTFACVPVGVVPLPRFGLREVLMVMRCHSYSRLCNSKLILWGLRCFSSHYIVLDWGGGGVAWPVFLFSSLTGGDSTKGEASVGCCINIVRAWLWFIDTWLGLGSFKIGLVRDVVCPFFLVLFLNLSSFIFVFEIRVFFVCEFYYIFVISVIAQNWKFLCNVLVHYHFYYSSLIKSFSPWLSDIVFHFAKDTVPLKLSAENFNKKCKWNLFFKKMY